MKWYLGIDPGYTGALAFFDPENDALEIFDMPTHAITVNKKHKRVIDIFELSNIVDCRSKETKKAVVEQVYAMTKQGVTSSFNFGFSAGCAQMVVAANFIPLTLVHPSHWKGELNVPRDKDAARMCASRIFPKHSGLWPLAYHDGRAEAALLAYYLYKQESN